MEKKLSVNFNTEMNHRKAREEAVRLRKQLIEAAENNFRSMRSNFVKLETGYYNKEQLVSVKFNDQSIHARFSTGDIVSITEEELLELTS